MIVELLLLLLVGLIAGFCSGLIGIGGGLFFIIVYQMVLQQYDFVSENDFVNMVIANSIFSTFFAGLASSIKQLKLGNFYWKPSLIIGIFGCLSSILLTIFVTEQTFYNKKGFAVVFSLVVIPLIYKMLKTPIHNTKSPNSIANKWLAFVGCLSGMGTALSGLGGSFIITPMLTSIWGVDIKKVMSVAVGAIMIVSGVTSLFNLLHQSYDSNLPNTLGGIHLAMVFPVITGVLVAAPLGVQVSKTINPKMIRILFLLFCFAIISRNCYQIFYS